MDAQVPVFSRLLSMYTYEWQFGLSSDPNEIFVTTVYSIISGN